MLEEQIHPRAALVRTIKHRRGQLMLRFDLKDQGFCILPVMLKVTYRVVEHWFWDNIAVCNKSACEQAVITCQKKKYKYKKNLKSLNYFLKVIILLLGFGGNQNHKSGWESNPIQKHSKCKKLIDGPSKIIWRIYCKKMQKHYDNPITLKFKIWISKVFSAAML